MVAHFQHVGIQVVARLQNDFLALLLRVSGKEEGGPPIYQPDHGGVVVGPLPVRVHLGGHNLELGARRALDGRALMKRADGQALGGGGVQQLFIPHAGGGLVLGHLGHVNAANVKALNDAVHAAHMVRVGVGGNQRVNTRHAQAFQVGGQTIGVLVLPRIDEHIEIPGLPRNADQLAVSLAHVQKIDLQGLRVPVLRQRDGLHPFWSGPQVEAAGEEKQ